MSNRQITRRIGCISLVTSIAAIIWLLMPFRIVNPERNQIIALLSFWLVFINIAIACACFVNHAWMRIAMSFLFAIFTVVFPIVVLLSTVAGGPIVGYDVLDSVKLAHSRVVAYRINGGATTDYGIQIVQEMIIAPGILLTKDLHTGNHEYVASLKLVRRNSVIAIIDEKPAIFELRPFIYF